MCNTLAMKNVKHCLNKLKEAWIMDIPYLWMERLKVIKMSILLKLVYRFNTFPIKIPKGVPQKLVG